MKPFDFCNAKFRVCDTMRYDSPGDYYLEKILVRAPLNCDRGSRWVFEVWSGLSRPEYIQEVFGHEVQEAMILVAAGITPEMIDVIDGYRQASWRYGEFRNTLTPRDMEREDFIQDLRNNVLLTTLDYEFIPKYLRDLYDEAHFKAIGWGRLFIEACGLDWKTYQQEIIDSRGKIPVRENP